MEIIGQLNRIQIRKSLHRNSTPKPESLTKKRMRESLTTLMTDETGGLACSGEINEEIMRKRKQNNYLISEESEDIYESRIVNGPMIIESNSPREVVG